VRPTRRRRSRHRGRHGDAARPLGPRRRRPGPTHSARDRFATDESVGRPFDPTGAAPCNDGLNSNYRYLGDATYRPSAALWCIQDGPTLRCTRRSPR
jgi:hypothetical protein